MNHKKESAYPVSELTRLLRSKLIKMSKMSGQDRLNPWISAEIQLDVNRLLLLERVPSPDLAENDLLNLNTCAKVMSENPAIAPIVAGGFEVTVRKAVLRGGNNA